MDLYKNDPEWGILGIAGVGPFCFGNINYLFIGISVVAKRDYYGSEDLIGKLQLVAVVRKY